MTQTFTLIAVGITLSVLSCGKQDQFEKPVTVDLQSTVPAGSSVSRGSSVSFSLGMDASKTVSWSSNPATGLNISASGNTANVQFNTNGIYTITGVLGNSAGSSTYTVKDSAVTLPSSYKDLAYAAGEELVLTAKRLGDSLAGGIQIGGYTTQLYPCGSWTKFTQAVTNNTLTVNFNGLLESLKPCSTGAAVVYVGGGGITAMAAGSIYQLVISFQGQVYTGSISKSGAGKFTIVWPYVSGVKIAPLAL
jgi:hypothetical protein